MTVQGFCGWIRAFPFEVVFTDSQLPYLDGEISPEKGKISKITLALLTRLDTR